MSLTLTPPNELSEPDMGGQPMKASTLSRVALLTIFVGCLVVGAVASLALGGFHLVKMLLIGLPLFVVVQWGVSRTVEGPRQATDRTATTLITGAFLVVSLPLISLIWTVVERGSTRMDWVFFSETMRGVVGEGGGIKHALIGTLIITGLAALFSIPFGLFTAIYLVEYSDGSKLARLITMMVDVMTGIPSIVAGLFSYALFVLIQGSGVRSGLAGAVALTVLMTPVVVRSSEEMLRLVQNELREASLALGVPKWKTITKVVLPTAIGGIVTGSTLAIARVIGETAPLLVTAGLSQNVNWNPLEGRMTTLPVQAYYSYATPTLPPELSMDRAWGAALVLIIVVAVLFSAARIMASVLKPKGLR